MTNYAELGLTVAKEALKPTSGFVDALLSPKLKKVRSWAEDRDIASRIGSQELEDAFDRYLRRLLRRASGMTTLVFPQRVLALPAVYEPLSLEVRPVTAELVAGGRDGTGEEGVRRSLISEGAITRPGARSYIVDGAGMGKSTFVRHLILRELVERKRIPLFVELRRIDEGTSLWEALARDLDELHKQFERAVFLRLMELGRFMVVLDGLDEVASTNRQALCQEIEELAEKAEKSTFIVTSRPEVPLPVLTGAKLLSLAPLTEAQTIALVRRYDAIGEIDVGDRLIAKLGKLPEQFLRTPLLVALLYRSFGYNGEVSANITTFYDELYSALYKGHDLTKAGFARPKESGLDFDSFRGVLRAFAVLLLAQQKSTLPTATAARLVIEDATRLTGIRPASSDAFLNDLLLSVPLLIRDGPELRFAHKTIGEFFAAEHLAFTQSGREMVTAMCKGGHEDRFVEAIGFLKDLNPSLFRRVVAMPFAEAYLLHCPTLPPAVRTLSFIAPLSAVILCRRGDEMHLGKPPNQPDDAASYRIHAALDATGDRVLQFYIAGEWRPLVGTVAPLFIEKAPRTSRSYDLASLMSLPERQWIPLNSPMLQEARYASALEGITHDLLGLYLRHAKKVRFDADESLAFDVANVHEVLNQVSDEERATDLLKALIGKPS